jgi:hypothetical protein
MRPDAVSLCCMAQNRAPSRGQWELDPWSLWLRGPATEGPRRQASQLRVIVAARRWAQTVFWTLRRPGARVQSWRCPGLHARASRLTMPTARDLVDVDDRVVGGPGRRASPPTPSTCRAGAVLQFLQTDGAFERHVVRVASPDHHTAALSFTVVSEIEIHTFQQRVTGKKLLDYLFLTSVEGNAFDAKATTAGTAASPGRWLRRCWRQAPASGAGRGRPSAGRSRRRPAGWRATARWPPAPYLW